MLLLSNGPNFPSHLRVKIPDTVFFNEWNYPSNHFCSDTANRLNSKSSVHLTLNQVTTTLMVKTRAAENKLKQHLESREGILRPSPVSTPPTVKVALTGSAFATAAAPVVADQNSRTLLLTAEAFEEI